MKSARVVWLAAVALLLPVLSVPLSAHHGGASFDVGKRTTVKGTVKEWIYSNPHCLLMLEVKGDDGQVVAWVAEGQAPSVVFPAGYRRDTFKPGDQVTVIVEPFKDGRPMGRIIQAVLGNGRTLGAAQSTQPAGGAAPQP
jgi:hypothetical protein